MKTLKNLFVKNNVISAVLILALLAFSTGCDNENSNPIIADQAEEISAEESAEIIAKELSGSEAGYGATAVCEDAAYLATGGNVNDIPESDNITGYSVNDTTIIVEDDVAPYTYYFEITYGYDFVKNGRTFPVWAPGIDTLAVRYSSDGTYAAPIGSGSRTAHTENLFIGGLALTSENYAVNGNYYWNSNSAAAVGDKTIIVNGNLKIQNLLINKTSLTVIGGSGRVEMTAETNGGNTVSVIAEIVFKSNATAEITINGKTYTADLSTGELL